MPMRAVNPPAAALEQRVIDRDKDRLTRFAQAAHDQGGDPQPELIHRPSRLAEKAVRTAVIPNPGEPRADEHPRHRSQPGL